MTSDQSGCTAEQSYRENERSPCACAGTAPAKRDRAASSCQTGSQCLQGRRSGLDHRTSAAGGSQSAADSSSPSSTSSFCARDSLGKGRGRYGQFTTDERLRQGVNEATYWPSAPVPSPWRARAAAPRALPALAACAIAFRTRHHRRRLAARRRNFCEHREYDVGASSCPHHRRAN
jgi:hypothetical protein